MVLPPTTGVQLSHAMVIRLTSAAASTVGAINEWNPKINRTLTDIYEFGQISGKFAHGSPGEPFEVAPGNVSGMSIDMRRWDLYQSQIETSMTTTDVTMLSNQFDDFQVREVWGSPNRTNDFYRNYLGCWWQDTGRNIDAKGDRTINVGGTIRYTRRDRGAA